MRIERERPKVDARALVWSIANALTLGLLFTVRCRHGYHAPDPRFARLTVAEAALHGLEADAPAWECARCFRRYPREDTGYWRPEEDRRARGEPLTPAEVATPVRRRRGKLKGSTTTSATPEDPSKPVLVRRLG